MDIVDFYFNQSIPLNCIDLIFEYCGKIKYKKNNYCIATSSKNKRCKNKKYENNSFCKFHIKKYTTVLTEYNSKNSYEYFYNTIFSYSLLINGNMNKRPPKIIIKTSLWDDFSLFEKKIITDNTIFLLPWHYIYDLSIWFKPSTIRNYGFKEIKDILKSKFYYNNAIEIYEDGNINYKYNRYINHILVFVKKLLIMNKKERIKVFKNVQKIDRNIIKNNNVYNSSSKLFYLDFLFKNKLTEKTFNGFINKCI